MIKVIIFDLDGLLVDSQPLQYKAYKRVFKRHGFNLSLEIWHDWIQNSHSVKEWVTRNNLKLDPEQMRAEKKVIYDKLICDELNLKVGAEYLVNALYDDKFTLCIASSSRIESIDLIVDKFRLRSKFKELVSDCDLKRSKPFPDAFLETAKLMNVDSSECLVIEDSLPGLQAAKAANMKCIICPDSFCSLDKLYFKQADKIVDSLLAISSEMIRSMN